MTPTREDTPAKNRGDIFFETLQNFDASVPPLTKTPSMKICILVEPSPFTFICGYANRFQEMLRFMAQAGDIAEIITSDVHTTTDLPKEKFGHKIHHTSGFNCPFYKSLTLSLDWKLKALRVIHRMKPDLLHVTSPGLLVFAAIFYSRLFATPLVMSYHTHLPIYVKKYLTFAPWLEHVIWFLIWVVHSFADLTLVTSPQIEQQFIEYGVSRVDVWRKGINTDRFHPRFSNDIMRHQMTNGSPKDFLMLYVGRLSLEKRIQDLKAIVDASPPHTRLCFVGSGPQEEQIRKMFEGDDRVVFTGLLEGDELSMAYASADVLVLPSDSETLGFVVLESMASGVPVVAARAGGIPSIIDDNVTSFLVTPGGVEEYLQRLQVLRSDTALRSRMGMAARNEAEKWGWGSSTSILRNVQYQRARENFRSRLEVQVASWLRDKWNRIVGRTAVWRIGSARASKDM